MMEERRGVEARYKNEAREKGESSAGRGKRVANSRQMIRTTGMTLI